MYTLSARYGADRVGFKDLRSLAHRVLCAWCGVNVIQRLEAAIANRVLNVFADVLIQ
jgi:hypothetical protein